MNGATVALVVRVRFCRGEVVKVTRQYKMLSDAVANLNECNFIDDDQRERILEAFREGKSGGSTNEASYMDAVFAQSVGSEINAVVIRALAAVQVEEDTEDAYTTSPAFAKERERFAAILKIWCVCCQVIGASVISVVAVPLGCGACLHPMVCTARTGTVRRAPVLRVVRVAMKESACSSWGSCALFSSIDR